MAEIRRLRESDLESVYQLSTVAGWNQTKVDWRRLLTLDPDGCYCTEEDGRVVSTTTAMRYGEGLAWVGMVLTRPEYRGRGYARKLVAHILEWLDSEGVKRTMLDATEMGQPLYEKLGFIPDYTVERWMRRNPSHNQPGRTIDRFETQDWVKVDRENFDADRSRLLDLLGGDNSGIALPGKGYALSRPGRIATYFGPSVAVDVDAARTLLTAFLAKAGTEAVMWDLLPANAGMIHLARAFGFEPMRYMTRMRRGGKYEPPSSQIVALAGLEFG